MTPDRLRQFFDLWNAHDVDAIVEFFTPDGVYMASIGPEDAGTTAQGHDELRVLVESFFASYPDVRYTDLEVAVTGDSGYATWTLDAGSGPDAVRYRGVDIFRFAGDLIASKDAYRKERSAPIG